MEVGNSTDTDAQYSVKGGGMPLDPPGPPEWRDLPAGTVMEHPDKLPGISPWTVTFLVEGRKIPVRVQSPSGKAVLLGNNGSLNAVAS